MNRKQVNAFLKIMSKDTFRPVLCSTLIDKFNGKPVMVATDGYVLTAVKLDDIDESYIGKRISREAIEKWYKLADGKSRLTGESIQELMEDDVHNGRELYGDFPKWQEIVPKESQAVDTIAFNADFAKTVQDLNAVDGLIYTLNGKLGAMVSDTDVAYTMLMPLKS